jgi:hypothetical protein
MGMDEGMVSRLQLPLFPHLEDGEVRDPKPRVIFLRLGSQGPKGRHPEGRQGRRGHPVRSRRQEGQVPGLHPHGLVGVLAHEPGEGPGASVLRSLHPQQPRSAGGPGDGLQALDVLPGQGGAPLQEEPTDPTPLLHGPLENPELQALQGVGPVPDPQGEAEIRPVRAVALHGLPVRHPGEGPGHFHVHQRPQSLHESLHPREEVVGLDEGGLDIDLGELGLPVGPEVLVPKAPGDLEVPVEARCHEELLVELGTLGEGEELPGMIPARDQEIPGSFRRGLGEDGCLHLQESQVVQVVPHRQDELVSDPQVPVHLQAPEVQDPVPEPEVLRRQLLLRGTEHGNGRCLALVQHGDPGGPELHLAGGHLRVPGFRWPEGHLPLHLDHVFRPDLPGPVQGIRPRPVRTHGDLQDARPVPEIQEQESSQVPTAMDPAADKETLTGVIGVDPSQHAGPESGLLELDIG